MTHLATSEGRSPMRYLVASALFGTVILGCISCGSEGSITSKPSSSTAAEKPTARRCTHDFDTATLRVERADGTPLRTVHYQRRVSGAAVTKLFQGLCEYVGRYHGPTPSTECPSGGPFIEYRLTFGASGESGSTDVIYQPRGCAYFEKDAEKAYVVPNAAAFDALNTEMSRLFKLDPTKVQDGSLVDVSNG